MGSFVDLEWLGAAVARRPSRAVSPGRPFRV